MFLDKYENEAIDEARSATNKIVENNEPLTLKRVVNICRGLAQRAIAFPNRAETIEQANRDNQMIDDNQYSIQAYSEIITNNTNGSPFMVDYVNKQLLDRIKDSSQNISKLKKSRFTSDDIINIDQAHIDHTPGGFLKIK
ncbi:MAG: hypothetical protein WCK26_01100 [Candidatus Saccharibacteria bacterium]